MSYFPEVDLTRVQFHFNFDDQVFHRYWILLVLFYFICDPYQ